MGEVGRAEDEDAAEAGQVGCRGRDERLARAHLPDDGGAALRLEGEGGAADGVGLRPQGRAQQVGQGFFARGGPVAGRVGLHHPLGDGVAVGVDELAEVHGSVPFSCRVRGRPRIAAALGGEAPSRFPIGAGAGPRLADRRRPVRSRQLEAAREHR